MEKRFLVPLKDSDDPEETTRQLKKGMVVKESELKDEIKKEIIRIGFTTSGNVLLEICNDHSKLQKTLLKWEDVIQVQFLRGKNREHFPFFRLGGSLYVLKT
jgi:hypothetical protein